jgi:hypothetical protein
MKTQFSSIQRSVRVQDLQRLGFTTEDGINWTLENPEAEVDQWDIDNLSNTEWSEMYTRLADAIDNY